MTIRIIPKIDIKNGRVIKGINLEGLRVLGDPNNFSKHYYQTGADEIIYLDTIASYYGTTTILKSIKQTAKNIFIPLTAGGGIRSLSHAKNILESGADKVCINSQVIKNCVFLKKLSKEIGSSNITSIVEVIKIDNKYYITSGSGRNLEKQNPLEWAKKLQDLGAGEILLICVNEDGVKSGFDLKIVNNISSKISIPLIVNGGAGNFHDIYELIKECDISGVAISSLFHYNSSHLFAKEKKGIGNYYFARNFKGKHNKNIILELKEYLKLKKIDVRL